MDWEQEKRELKQYIRELEEKLSSKPQIVQKKTKIIKQNEKIERSLKNKEIPYEYIDEQIKDFELGIEGYHGEKKGIIQEKEQNLLGFSYIVSSVFF